MDGVFYFNYIADRFLNINNGCSLVAGILSYFLVFYLWTVCYTTRGIALINVGDFGILGINKGGRLDNVMLPLVVVFVWLRSLQLRVFKFLFVKVYRYAVFS